MTGEAELSKLKVDLDEVKFFQEKKKVILVSFRQTLPMKAPWLPSARSTTTAWRASENRLMELTRTRQGYLYLLV